jgi:enoyl-CoA hydratase/carnithine racemase
VVRIFGMQLAGEIALTGRTLTANELQKFGFLRMSTTPDSLIDDALRLAADIGDMSPDAIVVTRAGLRQAWETSSVERSQQLIEQRYHGPLMSSENTRIGLAAFAKKQKPSWVPTKL